MNALFPDIDPQVVSWVIIPFLIFCARLLDVSIGTLRIVFVSRGDKLISPVLGFLEVLIWLIAIGQVMQNLNNVASYLAWAGGFAVGNYLGLILEERLAIGQMLIRIITAVEAGDLAEAFQKIGQRYSCVRGRGNKGEVNILFAVVQRKQIPAVIQMVQEYNPNAFYSIEDIRSVYDVEEMAAERSRTRSWRKLFPLRKGK